MSSYDEQMLNSTLNCCYWQERSEKAIDRQPVFP